MANRERGQSELVGFILIFGAVILAIAVLGVAGFGSVTSVEDHHRSTNAERAMTALAANVDEIAHTGAPDRTTEIGLADASLRSGPTTQVNVTLDGGSSSAVEATLTPIVYQTDDGTSVSYAGGTVIREDQGAAVMLRDPPFRVDENTTRIPVIETTPDDRRDIGGTTAVEVRTTLVETDVVHAGAVDSVTIEVTSPTVDAWERWFDRQADATCTSTGPTSVECEIDTEQATVTVTRIAYTFR